MCTLRRKARIREEEDREPSQTAQPLSPWMLERPAPTRAREESEAPRGEEPYRVRQSRLAWKGKGKAEGSRGKGKDEPEGKGKGERGGKGKFEKGKDKGKRGTDFWGGRDSQIHYVMKACGSWLGGGWQGEGRCAQRRFYVCSTLRPQVGSACHTPPNGSMSSPYPDPR